MPLADPVARKAYMDTYNAKRAEKRRPGQRAYYEANRKKLIEKQRAYYDKNKKTLCAKLKSRRNSNLEHFTIRAKYWRENNVAKTILNSARARAKKLNLHFTLTEADIIVPEVCPVLGISIRCAEKRWGSPNSPTLDRINAKGFYVPGNVRVISWRANRLKSDGTLAEFERIAAYIRGEL